MILLQPVHKYIDDTTITEILGRSTSSSMVRFVDELKQWSLANFMLINHSKTKEMILGPLNNCPPTHLAINGHAVERVCTFKLLGVIISNNLRWDNHITTISSKVNSKLYFLKQLKRAGLSSRDLLSFYTTVIRPVLEYACVIWHHGLTV